MSIDLRERLKALQALSGPAAAFQAERLYIDILRPLLAHDGYVIDEPHRPHADFGTDLTATRQTVPGVRSFSLGIQFKHYGSRNAVPVSQVHEAIGAALLRSFDRFLLVSNTGFTRAAIEAARNIEPVAITLIGPEEVEGWISRVEGPPTRAQATERVALLVRTISHEFAVLVAKTPEALDALEWRDLERMMARVLEGIGFDVILTPPSKDGGKDLILTCHLRDEERTYIVELKHWRSGKRVGAVAARDFLSVIARERRSGGLFLSTSGYQTECLEELTEVERRVLRFGSRQKIIALAQTYVRADAGLWSPPKELPEILFDETV